MTFLASSFLPSSSLIKHGVYVCVREKEKRGSATICSLSTCVPMLCAVHAEGGMMKGSHLSLNMSLYQCMCVREKEERVGLAASCSLPTVPTSCVLCMQREG